MLGSGLGRLADLLSSSVEIPFRDVPGLPEAGVAGHAGRFVAGRLGSVPVLIQAGRLHGYEGHSGEVVGLPILLAAAAGARFVLLTNSVGALRSDLVPGTLALLSDIVDLRTPGAPLSAVASARSLAFAPLRARFDPELSAVVQGVALDLGIALPRAVYACVTGPSYETRAEVRMLRRLGADLVAMSVAAEVEAAARVGLPVVGVSVVANLATGLQAEGLEHGEVLRAGARAAEALGRLIEAVLERVARDGVTSSATGPRRDRDETERSG